MKTRIDDFWSDWVARRGGANALMDFWMLTLVVALLLGVVLGYTVRS